MSGHSNQPTSPAATKESFPKEQARLRALEQPGGYLYPDLRIGRRALFSSLDALDAPDWHDFLAELDRKNQRRGSAKTLGTIACHYVTDTEMRSMVLAQDDQYRRRPSALKRYRELQRNLTAFLADMEGTSYRYDPGELCERPELMGKALSANIGQLAQGRLFRATRLVTKPYDQGGIDGYDGNVFGLDLSANKNLVEERNKVLRYLRTEEGLDTTKFVRADWSPHATIFKMRPHLTIETALKMPNLLPETLEVGPVQALSEF